MMYPFTNLTDHSQAAVDMLQWMQTNLDDFPPVVQAYEAALSTLTAQLGAAAVQAQAQAIRQQMLSDLLHSGWLGFKANLDHFRDPVARCFMDVDFEVFLQEAAAHSLPDYEEAQACRDSFFATLNTAQRSTYMAVLTYSTYLETVVPKLAHYFGYLLANELLPKLIPGYRPDPVQTYAYCRMLETYLGQACLPAELTVY